MASIMGIIGDSLAGRMPVCAAVVAHNTPHAERVHWRLDSRAHPGVRLARRAARTQDIVWPAGGAGGRETVLGHQARDTQRRRGPGIAARGALRPPTTEHPFAASRWRSKFSQGIHHWNLFLALSREISYENIIIHFSQTRHPCNVCLQNNLAAGVGTRRLRRHDLIMCLSA